MTAWIQHKVVQGVFGQFGHVTLNRPEALNALNLEMVLALDDILVQWEKDPAVLAVIIQSSSEKAFCAGGDIRALYDAGLKKDLRVFDFFKYEYQLDLRIARYSKPYISFLNGITMGGGVGISLHGAHRVAGENFKFALPETNIGFFPDIGGSYLLHECPGAFGKYLGLTGARASREEAYALNLVDYCVDLQDQSTIIQQLYALDLRDRTASSKVEKLLNQAHKTICVDHALKNLHWVNDIFSADTLERILQNLEEHAQENLLIEKTLNDLRAKSPLSLKITFEQLKRAEFLSIEECLQMDDILVHHFLQDHDFYEGVRALIIDKDNKPQWQPATLSDISEEQVNSYFLPKL